MDVPPIGHLRNPSHSISVVIPVLNEASAIGRLLPRVAARLDASGYGWEIVVVDDGSTDHLSEVVGLFALSDGRPNVQLVHLSRSFGKTCALSAGLEAARGNAVICMEGDGRHPPELIDELLRMWEDGHATVVGVRGRRLTERRWLSRAWNGFHRYRLSDRSLQMPARACEFRLMDRRVVTALLRLPERDRFMHGMVAWVGFKTAYLCFDAPARTDGESTLKTRQLKDSAVSGSTACSVRPLRLVAQFGLGMSVAALLYGTWIVLDTLYLGNPMSSGATMAAGMMLLSGMQLTGLGVMAEYLGRILEQTRQRPPYIVADHVDHSRLPAHAGFAGSLSGRAQDALHPLQMQA